MTHKLLTEKVGIRMSNLSKVYAAYCNKSFFYMFFFDIADALDVDIKE